MRVRTHVFKFDIARAPFWAVGFALIFGMFPIDGLSRVETVLTAFAVFATSETVGFEVVYPMPRGVGMFLRYAFIIALTVPMFYGCFILLSGG